MTITLEEVQALVDQLSLDDKHQLWDRLATQLEIGSHTSAPATPSAMTPTEARAIFDDLRATLSALPQPRHNLGEQLDRDRAERQASLEGAHNVHS